MLVGVISDIHLETGFGELQIPDCDLLLLAGDILVAKPSHTARPNLADKLKKRYTKFLSMCSSAATNTVIIAGNHEYYGWTLDKTPDTIRDLVSEYQNIHFLHNEDISFGDVNVFGSTFWTDLNRHNPMAVSTAQSNLADYRYIYKDFSTQQVICADDTVAENKYGRVKLNEFLSKGHKKTIVVTHHAPSWACVRDDYRDDILSYAYVNTGLDDLILDGNGPDYWVFGHTHQRLDFMHGDKTRFICNARGYFSEKMAKTAEVKLIEV